MELHRVLFRLDYPNAFTLFTEWGNVLALLDAGGFWTELGENTSSRTIIAKRGTKLGNEVHGLNVEVNDINGVFEAHPIVSPRDYAAAFNDVSKIVSQLRVEEFNRLGVRFIFLEPVPSFKEGLDPIVGRVSKDYWEPFEDAPRDIAITSVHGGKDQSLRLTVGPISKQEYAGRWFLLPEQVSVENGLMFDVDCYASGYKFKSFDFSKVVELYFGTAFDQAKRMVELLKGKE